jgi:hypothetical protein
MEEMKIRAMPAPWWNGVQLMVSQGSHLCKTIIFEEVGPGEYVEPQQISMVAAQTLMDDLWSSGLRPTEGSGSAGALAATERHLADMQKLVFKNQKG